MIKASRQSENRRTGTGFVLIRGSTGQEQRSSWEWLTQRNLRREEQQQQDNGLPRLSYRQKKRILSGLQHPPKSSSSFKIRAGFNISERKRISSTASCTSLRSQRKTQPFVYLNSNQEQIQIPALNFGIDVASLIKSIRQAHHKGNSLIAVISVKRMGLRYKFNHAFVPYCGCGKGAHEHELRDVAGAVKKQMKEYGRYEKELYFYSSKGVPLHSYGEIAKMKFRVILVDSSPKLQFTTQLQQKVQELADKIELVLTKRQNMLQMSQNQIKNTPQNIEELQHQEQQHKYDHQRIRNVKAYVQKISQNPDYKLTDHEQPQNQLLNWYKQKYSSVEGQQKQTDKNLLFQTKNHYPNEIVNRKLLSKANDKVESFTTTNNRHKFIAERIEIMMEQVQRQNPPKRNQKQKQKKKELVIEAPITKKDMLLQLDKKNSLLTTQNIPYLIQKYGLNRFQLHNLYNLYKCFQKIAVMRSPNHQTINSVKTKGIDRQTFEVGLKGLDMNPGDELIKGICHFGDFISWQQFIKIISISLRKTPEQKLTATLKGISSFDTGHLSKHQISIMIGSSLHKLFDHEQPQLKQYFTNMAMTQFNSQNGQVPVDVLKQKVLNKGTDNMNMVSFLILNT